MDEQNYEAPVQETYQVEPEASIHRQDEYEVPEVQETISDKEKNFRNIRARNQELERRIAELEASQKRVQESYSEDDLVDRRVLNKELNGLKQQLHETTIRMKFPDFDKVVNDKTIEKLKKEDPYLAYSLGTNPDAYSQSVAVYNAIKRYGLVDDDQYEKQHNITERNMSKPRSSNSLSPRRGESPLSHANAFSDGPLTEEQRDYYYREMEQARKYRN